MKRLKRLLWIPLLFLCSTLWAADSCEPIQLARMNPYIAGAGVAAGGVTYTDCSQIGTHAFYWNGDYSGSNVKGCKNSTTTITGTLTNATIVDSASEPGTSSPTSGSNILNISATSQSLLWNITGGDIFNSSEGQICFDIYLSGSTGTNSFYAAYYDANNYVTFYHQADNTIVFQHKGNAQNVTVTSTDTIADTTWTNICGRWSVSNNRISIKIGSGSWKDDSDADTVTAFSTEPSTFGPQTQAISQEYYLDNITCDTSSGM